jgi:preprotein translocase subunit YajC
VECDGNTRSLEIEGSLPGSGKVRRARAWQGCEQRQKKQQAAMLAGLQSGNEVVTTGGIVGTVVSVAQDTLIVRVKPDNIKLQIARSAVASLVNPEKALDEKK